MTTPVLHPRPKRRVICGVTVLALPVGPHFIYFLINIANFLLPALGPKPLEILPLTRRQGRPGLCPRILKTWLPPYRSTLTTGTGRRQDLTVRWIQSAPLGPKSLLYTRKSRNAPVLPQRSRNRIVRNGSLQTTVLNSVGPHPTVLSRTLILLRKLI